MTKSTGMMCVKHCCTSLVTLWMKSESRNTALCRVTSGAVAGCLMMGNHTETNQKGYIMANENTKAAVNAAPVADEDTMELSLSSDRFAALDIGTDLKAATGCYCSMTAVDNAAKVTLYNVCSSPAKISDMINKRISVLHIYVEVIQVLSESSGEFVNAPRVILIDEKGKGYQAVSTGIYNSVKRMINLFGDPANWDTPHTVEVKNVSLANGQHTFSLEMIS